MNDGQQATPNPPVYDTAAQLATRPALKPQPVRDAGEFSVLLDTDRFVQIQRVAQLFSESDFVPAAFHGKPANCAVALQMAFRMQIDPMMLMQNMYIVHGRPGIEAKLAIALINARGPFTGPLQWRIEGQGEARAWTCYATHKITGEQCAQTVTAKMVSAEGWDKKEGSKWKTLPDLMGQYRSAMFLGRLYCPETLLGLPTGDELDEVGEHLVIGERLVEVEPTPTTAVEKAKEKVRGRPPKVAAPATETPPPPETAREPGEDREEEAQPLAVPKVAPPSLGPTLDDVCNGLRTAKDPMRWNEYLDMIRSLPNVNDRLKASAVAKETRAKFS